MIVALIDASSRKLYGQVIAGRYSDVSIKALKETPNRPKYTIFLKFSPLVDSLFVTDQEVGGRSGNGEGRERENSDNNEGSCVEKMWSASWWMWMLSRVTTSTRIDPRAYVLVFVDVGQRYDLVVEVVVVVWVQSSVMDIGKPGRNVEGWNVSSEYVELDPLELPSQ
ncbi:hypothetical protein F2Q69_00006688 [Brassica cretica]|uniref:Uncharacterized protein n=1 Tax=Brassica cretica TaxID=69181 RepID=A0A8S9NZA0_BRACR|nr:hypothetical protein F2Q69_00006688 [Brassica cretica]